MNYDFNIMFSYKNKLFTSANIQNNIYKGYETLSNVLKIKFKIFFFLFHSDVIRLKLVEKFNSK